MDTFVLNRLQATRTAILTLLLLSVGAASARATDQIYFSSSINVTDQLVQRINAETIRIDMSCWYLTEHAISIALLNRFKAGVPVRLIGDRGSIFEIDAFTRNEFYWLASQGVPIRLRYNPTWYPEIDHWKMTIFAGQNMVAFGSGNYTPFELAPASPTNYKDEVFLFTDDPSLTGAFKTKFDRLWNDTTAEPESLVSTPPYFKNWDAACALESACSDYQTQYPTRVPMNVNTARLEPDNPLPPEMVWGQGATFNNRLVQEINNESVSIDLVSYRLTVPSITDALIAKFKAGVPTRVIIEPNEYLNRKWPEFWLTHANVDKLYAAGVPVKQRLHDGLTHMKVLVTSKYATVASSNFAAAWQRDHDYFLPSATKPAAYSAIKNHVGAMWSDTVAFTAFKPLPPDAATLASPTAGAIGLSTAPTLVWNRAAFAVSYDVYLGTSQNALNLVGNVAAQLINDPPTTYSWTPSTPLGAGTTFYWKVVSRTNATPVDPTMVADSAVGSFSTTGTATTPPSTTPPPPSTPPPSSSSTPYGGSTAAVPGLIEAERFDDGGEGVGYHDVDAVNSGGQFRTTGVDIEATTDANGGFNVGWMAAGEWLNYTVNVAAAGSYRFDARVAASGAGGTFHVEAAGVNLTGPLSIPNTGGWQTWTTVSTTITLAAGPQILRLVVDSASPAGVVGNLNYLRLTSATTTPTANTPPTVSLTAPVDGATATAPASITVSATASDNDGTIAKIDFFNGTTLIGTATSSPYTMVWSNLAAGTYSLTARATDNGGATATSSAAAVSVSAGGTTTPPPTTTTPTNVVIYAADIPAGARHGSWTSTSDPTSPAGIKLATPDNAAATISGALASPADYVDVTFAANAGTPYTFWLRVRALNNSKYNDSLFVQFSDALSGGSPIYGINTGSALLVNLATDSTGASVNGWGWQNTAYWLSQATTVTFSTSGTHTLRLQVREDGVQFDQIVLSPAAYLSAAPGSVVNDATIVPKP